MRYARRTTDYSILDNIGIIMLKTIITKQFSLCMLKVIPCRTYNLAVPGVVAGPVVLSPSGFVLIFMNGIPCLNEDD